MSLTLIHTSDWHLGHSLRDWSREEEHAFFLDWLLGEVVKEKADALLVAGDLFDTSNPSAAAQRQFYGFLARLRDRSPHTRIVMIGGNHDSAARLDAPEPLLSALQIHIVGTLPYVIHGEHSLDTMDFSRLLVPLKNREGQVEAWVAAVPYLREPDLPVIESEEDTMQAAVGAVYGRLSEELEKRREPGQVILAMGHCFVAGATASPNSERKIQGGAEAWPVDLFPKAFQYVALGHIHKPTQPLPDRICYSGAPLPFSMDEGDYGHRIQVLSLENGALQRKSIPIPCITEIWVKPSKEGAFTMDEVEAWILSLPKITPDFPDWKRPFLELRVRGAYGQWERLLRMLSQRSPRLVKLTDVRPEGNVTQEVYHALADLSPTEVFGRRWRQIYKEEPILEEVMNGFQELLEQAEHGDT